MILTHLWESIKDSLHLFCPCIQWLFKTPPPFPISPPSQCNTTMYKYQQVKSNRCTVRLTFCDLCRTIAATVCYESMLTVRQGSSIELVEIVNVKFWFILSMQNNNLKKSGNTQGQIDIYFFRNFKNCWWLFHHQSILEYNSIMYLTTIYTKVHSLWSRLTSESITVPEFIMLLYLLG